MFEITGDNIKDLGDGDLRSLVTKLAIAEMRSKGQPVSSVTAGGDQDAQDGGVDVRVECPTDIVNPDFVPRRVTGFQVKKPNMKASEIRNEMRPKNEVRDSIRQLVEQSGAYVIISSQGSVADKPLKDRLKAMRDALHDIPNADNLKVDFYDRERLATWVNQYPGIVLWVREILGSPLFGWDSIDNWEGGGAIRKPYLFNEEVRLIDECSSEKEKITIAEGIARLRARLCVPKQCIRLIGVSGLGKTRFVQALFEEHVGKDSLDSSLAVYTDYSETTTPTARDMAYKLIARRQRAIFVIDNCNPKTHSELVEICKAENSEISLITIEYDIREDEFEYTDIFRLSSAPPELIIEYIKQNYPKISQVDRKSIAGFSNGNFRVANALARTLGKGENLGRLKDSELFERIFLQRNQPENQLIQAAQDLSLLYSINGEDVSNESELAQVGNIRGIDTHRLYEALAELKNRGVVQSRGKFRAILPEAIANRLASQALERIPPVSFDLFCKKLTPRMRKSVSRRLGYLHDSPTVQAVASRWLKENGPFGDLLAMEEEGIQIINNVTPVVPEAVLERLENAIDGHIGNLILDNHFPYRYQWIQLIKAIGYDEHLFHRASILLARFLAVESEGNNRNSAKDIFSEFFHISLSGTLATPEQRRETIRYIAALKDARLHRCVYMASQALLKSGHFKSSMRIDFGARSRDWGWQYKSRLDINDWFENSIKLVIEVLPPDEARELLAKEFRGLWRYENCHDVLKLAVETFLQTKPWIEGWEASLKTLRFDGKGMTEYARICLEQVIKRMEPRDLLDQARAFIINGVVEVDRTFDGEENQEEIENTIWEKGQILARKIGRQFAKEPDIRSLFISELFEAEQVRRALEFGYGLAEGADDLNEIWAELLNAYCMTNHQNCGEIVLCGFISEAHKFNQNFTTCALEGIISISDLLPIVPNLQRRVGLDVEGIERLRRIISKGSIDAWRFCAIAGHTSKSPPDYFVLLLKDIAKLTKGVEVALDILQMDIYSREHHEKDSLISLGRNLLSRADFSLKDSPFNNYEASKLIVYCLKGDDARGVAKKLCVNISSILGKNFGVVPDDLHGIIGALFKTQPFVSLDTFLLESIVDINNGIFEVGDDQTCPIEILTPAILVEWADRDPKIRYPLLAKNISMFIDENNEEKKDLSPLFISILDQTPDKKLFLGDLWQLIQPRSWSIPLADVLIRRKELITKLLKFPDEHVQDMVNDILPKINQQIEKERGQYHLYHSEEESFE